MDRLPIESIVVRAGRKVRRSVDDLAASIREVGLLNPITVDADNALISGLHRLEACRLLGWHEIPVNVMGLDGKRSRLAEIDENLCRSEMTALERGELLAERKVLYEEMHPETKKGVAGGVARQGSASETVSFAADAAAKTGLSRRSVEQSVQVAKAISPEAKAVIENTPIADKPRALLEIARKPAAKQVAEAERQIKKAAKPAVRGPKPSDPVSALVVAFLALDEFQRGRFLSHPNVKRHLPGAAA